MMQIFYYFSGLGILFLNKLRYAIKGYRSPRQFGAEAIAPAIQYAKEVPKKWLKLLEQYSPQTTINNKNVLELGVGADLGIGLNLLSLGANKYCGLDINRLIDSTPRVFYNQLLEQICPQNKTALLHELELAIENRNPNQLNYQVNKNFDPNIFNIKFDLVFSQAAFEHFSEAKKTFSYLGQVAKPGAILVAEIDLKTHSRWIREKDPNNIYRYTDFLYKLAHYSGIPNRLRPIDYEKLLTDNGFGKIKIIPLKSLTKKEVDTIMPHLSKKFRSYDNQMEVLEFALLAAKL